MQEYTIDVTEIEELQTIKDTDTLDRMFAKAQSTIVGGEKVVLVRRQKDGSCYPFEEYTTLEDLTNYKKSVYKYL